VEKVRALARGEYGELNIGTPVPHVEILPPRSQHFKKRATREGVVA